MIYLLNFLLFFKIKKVGLDLCLKEKNVSSEYIFQIDFSFQHRIRDGINLTPKKAADDNSSNKRLNQLYYITLMAKINQNFRSINI